MTLYWKPLKDAVDFWGAFEDPHAGRFISGTAGCLLRELVENDQALKIGDSIRVSCEELYGLDAEDRAVLGLPAACPFLVMIESIGSLPEKDFHYRVTFHRGGTRQHVGLKRIGMILYASESEVYLASEPQFRLFREIEHFHSIAPEERDYRINLSHFGRVKQYALEAEAALEPYLANESVVLPEGMSIELQVETDKGFGVLPTIGSEWDSGFQTQFARHPNVRDVYSVSSADGGRNRVVFSAQQSEALKVAKELGALKGKALEDFLEHPESYFDPDVVDLDQFSRRVAEIGLYKPRYSAFVSHYKSQWLPILNIQTSPEANLQIAVTSRERMEELEEVYLDALRSDRNLVSVEGVSVPVTELRQLLDRSRQHFELTESGRSGNEPESSSANEVLLIRENIDQLEHSEFKGELDVSRPSVTLPPTLRGQFGLLKHQLEGLAWLQGTCDVGAPGVLLADDMGLGKTLQVLSFFDWHRVYRNPNCQPYLVVAPLSLLENWHREYERFFDGTGLKIHLLQRKSVAASVEKLLSGGDECALCLTTYETLRSEQKSLCRIDWACVAMDEAQRIKTPGTLVTNAAKALKVGFRVAMTGTPIENSFLELWCIMDFCVPGLLGCAKDFAERYQRPLRSEGVDVVQLGENLRNEVGSYILRRFKEDVLEGLPSKIERSVPENMPRVQRTKYLDLLERTQQLKQSDAPPKGYMLKAIAEMRTVSDHPLLYVPDVLAHTSQSLIECAARLRALVKILGQIKSQHEKCIVFSESRRMQQILAKTICEVFGLDHVSIINGDTPSGAQQSSQRSPSRQQTIDAFQAKAGFNVIIMSPLAAGVGLNVVAANHVVHFSRHWNPAKEAQATDRAYRIGQVKDVYVYYLLAVAEDFETFDVVLDDLLKRKKSLSSASLYPSEMAEVEVDLLFDRVCDASTSAIAP